MDARQSYEAKEMAKKITFLVGMLAAFVGGIAYMLISDLAYGNQAQWLIIATVLSIGSAICFFFSDNMKDFPKKQLILRCVGLALAVGFVIFVHLNTCLDFYKNVNFAKVSGRNASTIISLIFGYIGIVGQAANVTLLVVFKEEE